MAKPTLLLLLVIIFLLPNPIFKLCYSIILCPEIEKQALLSFKHSLEDPSNLLSSWNTSNCCNWKGVVCSNVTGNVHQLHLQGNGRFSKSSLQGKLNPCLLQLKHLKHLDVSQNAFDGRIPSFMGSLTSLEYLNLSHNGFYGKIPPTIGNLSKLHSLSLDINSGLRDQWEVLDADGLEWLRGLSQLEHLNMDWVNLTKASAHWMQVVNSLPSLVELHLSSCRLYFNFDPPSDDVNITSLEILDLSDNNNFESFPIPKWIFRQSSLVFLDLSKSRFGGLVPTSSNITKLRHINLDGNHFNSTNILDWLYTCKDLEFVSMKYNSLQGSISDAIGNLTSLTTLDLSTNQLSGEIPRGILNLCKLQRLDLSNNMLQGEMPNMIGHMWGRMLQDLRLSHNRLTGTLPTSVGRLSNLEVLDIENNMMSGVVTESHFANLTKLTSFIASGNQLSLKLNTNWSPPFKLVDLKLGSWKLGAGSGIPSWLETEQSTMSELDLSNTGISGNVPTWFWKTQLILNLSHNHLSGKIPDIIECWEIHLNSNQFSGPLPRVGNNVMDINLSNNSFSGDISHFLCDLANKSYELTFLNLGGNQLTGEIPNCWMKWLNLRVVNLGDNNFSGSIPDSIGTPHLSSLNLNNNKLSGNIPISIRKCTRLVKMDLSGNDLIGNIPSWIGTSLTNLKILILRSNKLRGTIPWSICHLNSLQIVDLSNNAFSGRIPSCVSNFTAMTMKRNVNKYVNVELYGSSFTELRFFESASVTTKGKETHYDTFLALVNTIDLSNNDLSGRIPKELTSLVELKSLSLAGNRLTGPIPESVGDLKQLESLDLSRNALSGEMPNSFSAMSFLSYLNLSCNNLRGRIPKNTQFDGMDASSFGGNDLCGSPLTRKCRGDDDGDGEDEGKEDNQEDKPEVEWLYVVLSLGYAVGFSVCCTTLVLKKSWRMAYFGLVDRVWDKLYVYYHIKCTKLWRPRTETS